MSTKCAVHLDLVVHVESTGPDDIEITGIDVEHHELEGTLLDALSFDLINFLYDDFVRGVAEHNADREPSDADARKWGVGNEDHMETVE